jgi:hypothetical protein
MVVGLNAPGIGGSARRNAAAVSYRRLGSAMTGGCAGWRNSSCAREKKEIRVKILKMLDSLSKKQRNNSGRNSG